MASGKNIYKVLVAGANDKTFALLQTLLPGSSYDPPLRAGSAGEAKRTPDASRVCGNRKVK